MSVAFATALFWHCATNAVFYSSIYQLAVHSKQEEEGVYRVTGLSSHTALHTPKCRRPGVGGRQARLGLCIIYVQQKHLIEYFMDKGCTRDVGK